MQLTKIGWTDFSSNPIRARNIETGKAGHFCEKVSPGCAHCFASEWNENRYGTGMAFLPANRSKVEFWLNERELAEWQKPKYAGKRVFVCDMTDLFGEWVPDEWLDRIFAAMALSPATFLLLTKRPERMREYMTNRAQGATENGAKRLLRNKAGSDAPVLVGKVLRWPMPHLWLGVSVENQRWADERIPILLACPAAVWFVSCEPLLSPVELMRFLNDRSYRLLSHFYRPGIPSDSDYFDETGSQPERSRDLDWVIVGGESGPRARPMKVEWAQSIVDQCKAAGVACYVKQDSGRYPGQQGDLPDELWAVKEWPEVRA